MKLTNSGYEHDVRLEQKLSKEIRYYLGEQFITQDPSEDRHTGTDFVIWALNPIKAACRLRRFEYYERYPDDFTIRWSRPSGVETEIHKIRKHLVDYLLYGFVDREERHIISYFIGNLRMFADINPRPMGIKTNDPPDSQLAVFSLNQLPDDFIIKRWFKTPPALREVKDG